MKIGYKAAFEGVLFLFFLCSCTSRMTPVPLRDESQGRDAGFRVDLPIVQDRSSTNPDLYVREFKQTQNETLVFSRAVRGDDPATIFLIFNIANSVDHPLIVYVVRNGRAEFKFQWRFDTGS
jgi:hypothetical protein